MHTINFAIPVLSSFSLSSFVVFLFSIVAFDICRPLPLTLIWTFLLVVLEDVEPLLGHLNTASYEITQREYLYLIKIKYTSNELNEKQYVYNNYLPGRSKAHNVLLALALIRFLLCFRHILPSNNLKIL